MKTETREIVYQEESSYKDILLRRGGKMRIFESILFVIGIILTSLTFESGSGIFKLTALVIAIAIVALAPFFYKWMLTPRYTLTKTHLIISMGSKETSYPLNEVEAIMEGRHFYRLRGKRHSLMVSRSFLARLDEQLHLFNRKSKRR